MGHFFFRACFPSIHNHFSLLTFFSYSVLLHSCCSHAPMFGKTLVHEFLIYYSQSEWYMLFFKLFNYKFTMCILSENVEILVH